MDVTCDNLPRVSAYHDGELPDAAAAEVERHLAACAACAAELAAYRGVSQRFAAVELPALSNAARRRLRRALEDERAAGRLRIVRALTAVAASVFLVTASHVIHQQVVGGRDVVSQPRPDGTPGVSVMLPQDVLLPASPAPESSFARFMVDGLEQGK